MSEQNGQIGMNKLAGKPCWCEFDMPVADWPVPGSPAKVVLLSVDMPMIEMRGQFGGTPFWISAGKVRRIWEENPKSGKTTEQKECEMAVRAALIDADHLAECADRLLTAMNRQSAAEFRLSEQSEGGGAKEAETELARAQEVVSDLWRATRSAACEYRKRAERARAAL